MKIVVIGGSGLIGTKLVTKLRQRGHEVMAASPSTGVDIISGKGLAAALAGAQVVVDVANAPSWEDQAVLEFFEKAGQNILAAEAAAGVGHHVALSVIGTDRLLKSGYFRAKMAQENLIRAAKIPYTIVRAGQFFEFVGGIAAFSTVGNTIRMTNVQFQPMAAEDVAGSLADVALAPPANGIVEVAGPEALPLDEAVQRYLRANDDKREVTTDVNAPYYGVQVSGQMLLPGKGARITSTSFDTWLKQSRPVGAATAR